MMTEESPVKGFSKNNILKTIVAWAVSLGISAGLIGLLFIQPKLADKVGAQPQPSTTQSVEIAADNTQSSNIAIPEFTGSAIKNALIRAPITHTEIDTSLRIAAVEHTVQAGDSIFAISELYDVSPDSIMWSNDDVLNDNVHLIYEGQVLKIPPTDGVWYKLSAKDTLEKVAAKFHVTVRDILLYVGNNLDLTNPVVEAGSFVMVPDGWREYDTSVYVPNILRDSPNGPAGVTTSRFYQCDTSGITYAGSGYFIWPSSVHFISGNDYFAGHLAIDIGAGMGSPIYAADYGVVVYAGWMDGGYGNVVIIDHNNGFTTVYAHLSGLNVNCGNTVNQGNVIGYGGSSGNSTGPHLHFEIRYNGGFVNPHLWLP